jgi:hypothetical protein
MNGFRNLPLMAKLLAGFAVVGVGVGLIAWMGLRSIGLHVDTENLTGVHLIGLMAGGMLIGLGIGWGLARWIT